MARIRTIKPEYWSHPVMGRTDDASKSLGVAILNIADDEGYFLADPALVRSSCRPFDDDSTITRSSLNRLVETNWIEVRTHPTHGLIGRVVNFSKHQVIDRSKPSKLRSYFEGDASANDRREIPSGREGEQEGNRERNGKAQCGTVTNVQGIDQRPPDPCANYEPEVALAVTRIMAACPTSDPDGREIPANGQKLALRVEEILAKNPQITGEILAQAWDDYLTTARKGTKAPQYFFGEAKCQSNADGANWVEYVRYLFHRNSQGAKAKQDNAASENTSTSDSGEVLP